MRWFTQYVMPSYDCQWFHELICKTLDRFLEDPTFNKLGIFMPPQCGKSEAVSRLFPAYILGKHPHLKITLCGYGDDFTSDFNRDVQLIMSSEPYQELFPHTKLSSGKDKEKRTTKEFKIVGESGGLRTVGIGGQLTGKRSDIAIIDDPVKDMVDAMSPTIQKKNWSWYNNVLCMRQHNQSKQVICLTRWHELDLWGRIQEKEGEEWQTISLPGIKEDDSNPDDPREIGDALWPDRHSKEEYEKAKKRSPRTFASLIQQRPAPDEGGIFKAKWFKYYTKLPDRFDKIIQSWDFAFKDTTTSDYVAGTIWGKHNVYLYLIGLFRGKWDFTESVKQIKNAIDMFPGTGPVLIEDKANGPAIISAIKKRVSGIIPVTPKESKEARAYASTDYFEAGNILLPTVEVAPWVSDVEHELKVFPNGRYDDIVDTVTQVIKYNYLQHIGWAGNLPV